MLTQSKATMYLSGERSQEESETYRSFGSFSAEGKQPFGALVSVDEVTLASGKTCMIDAIQDLDYIILPVVGTIYFESGKANNLVNPGQALFISPLKNNELIITNPYGDELINFLQIGFKRMPGGARKTAGIFSFDLDNNKNRIIAFGNETCDNGSFRRLGIGKFDGRAEMVYQPASPKNGVFYFVVAGAFEIQYRLLEAKDGLAIWNTTEMELEASSNEAILLTIELPIA